MKTFFLATTMMLGLALTPALADRTPAPEGAEVYFVNLEDGDTVSGPVQVIFGLRNMGVAPAGVERAGTGHHHVLVNRDPFGEAEMDSEAIENGLPADENHIHFGGGQTQATLDLAPGTHTLQLLLGDQYHVPHAPPVASDVITITVE